MFLLVFRRKKNHHESYTRVLNANTHSNSNRNFNLINKCTYFHRVFHLDTNSVSLARHVCTFAFVAHIRFCIFVELRFRMDSNQKIFILRNRNELHCIKWNAMYFRWMVLRKTSKNLVVFINCIFNNEINA